MTTDEARIDALFTAAYDDLCRFVRRRSHDGDDVVSETFLVAWRRLDDVPTDPGDARAWLFGVARRLLANQRRRGQRLVAWDEGRPPDDVAADDGTAGSDARVDVGRAFARLSARDQETLALVAWDDLSAAQAASVLEISVNAFGVRLHRARSRLRAHMGRPPAPAPITVARPPSSSETRSTS